MKNNIKRLIYYKLLEIRCYLNFFLRTPEKGKKVIIFAQGRTGSSLLESLLCSTGHFSQTNEPLNVKRKGEVWFPRIFIEGFSRMITSPNFIFHVKFYQLNTNRQYPIDPHDFLKYLTSKGWKIIYLHRKNKLLHAMSNILVEERSQSAKYDNKKEDFQFNLDIQKLELMVQTLIEYEKKELNYLRDMKFKEVIYEDDLLTPASQKRTIQNILYWLNLENREAHTKNKKVNTRPLSAQIINHKEFLEVVKKRNWMSYLNKN